MIQPHLRSSVYTLLNPIEDLELHKNMTKHFNFENRQKE